MNLTAFYASAVADVHGVAVADPELRRMPAMMVLTGGAASEAIG